MKYDGFVGPEYALRAKNAAQDRCVNMYPATVQFGGKTDVELRSTPGIASYIPLPQANGRGLWSGEGKLYAAANDTIYDCTSGTAVVLGTINAAATPVTTFSNGRQLMFISGSQVWISDGGAPYRPSFGTLNALVSTAGTGVTWASGDKFPSTLAGLNVTINGVVYLVNSWIDSTHIVLTASAGAQVLVTFTFTDYVSAVAGACIGGYFVVLSPNSNTLNVSASFDGSKWSSLDYQTRTSRPDRLQMIYAVGNNLWLFGTKTSEVWTLSASSFPLDLIPGSIVDYGIWAPFSVAALGDNAIAWVSSSERGIGPIMLARGIGAGAVQRISPDPQETEIQTYSNATDGVGATYTKDGHTFYILSFPSANKTIVYDLASKMWHTRTYWNGSAEVMQLQRFYGTAGREVVALAPTTGKIYLIRSDVYDDDGADIIRTRQAPHLTNDQQWVFYSSLQLDANVGQGATANPSYTLEYSNDGGNTFLTGLIQVLGAVGNFKQRLYWNRLGRSRDRVFRITTRARNPHSWVACYLDTQKGNGI